jgi:hypothetical protein
LGSCSERNAKVNMFSPILFSDELAKR